MNDHNDPGNDGHGWVARGSTDSNEVAAYYDGWAADYDNTLANWDYRAPADAAALLAEKMAPEGCALVDIGCGTGLSGVAMAAVGFGPILGLDISSESLKIASTRPEYAGTLQQDLQKLPLPVADNSQNAACCIGVLTYIENSEPLLRDIMRLLQPNGLFVFTMRDDYWESREYAAMVRRLAEEGVWTVERVTDPKPYLPNNSDFSDAVRVKHVVCRKPT